MTAPNIPFQPIRSALYSAAELLQGFDPGEPQSFAHTKDFDIYRNFVMGGGANSDDLLTTMLQSLHDNSITQALRRRLHETRCVATMGGHDVARNDPSFERMALLSRELSHRGYIVASGGGPGAMEATHFGAFFAKATDSEFARALKELASVPHLPSKLSAIIDPSGNTNTSLVAQVHSWLRVAVELLSTVKDPGASVAVPTWRYGHEPSTPFASDIAKYFQNSIREDGLISIGSHGTVFTEGKAGTIQEIFQNATNNYYASFGTFTPMVFLGSRYWTETYPIFAVLQKLFTADQIRRCILVTDEIAAVISFIDAFKVSIVGKPRPTLNLQAHFRTPDFF